jgi:hypothetical protein
MRKFTEYVVPSSRRQKPKTDSQRIDEELPFHCSRCDRSFATERGFKAHNTSVHKPAAEPPKGDDGNPDGVGDDGF